MDISTFLKWTRERDVIDPDEHANFNPLTAESE